MTAKTPYGIEIQESCASCSLRAGRIFCDLPAGALEALDRVKYTAVYPKGAILYVEGQVPLGVFVVCTGRVKLSTSTRDGRTLITQIADPGEVLGVAAVVRGHPFDVTAETLEPCQLQFIKRDDFVEFLRSFGDVSLRLLQLLSATCQCSQEQARSIGLSQSVVQRLARFLVDRCERDGDAGGRGILLRLGLTHEEIGQILGTSRETVTRALGQLRRKRIVRVNGSTLVVPDLEALRAIAT